MLNNRNNYFKCFTILYFKTFYLNDRIGGALGRKVNAKEGKRGCIRAREITGQTTMLFFGAFKASKQEKIPLKKVWKVWNFIQMQFFCKITFIIRTIISSWRLAEGGLNHKPGRNMHVVRSGLFSHCSCAVEAPWWPWSPHLTLTGAVAAPPTDANTCNYHQLQPCHQLLRCFHDTHCGFKTLDLSVKLGVTKEWLRWRLRSCSKI